MGSGPRSVLSGMQRPGRLRRRRRTGQLGQAGRLGGRRGRDGGDAGPPVPGVGMTPEELKTLFLFEALTDEQLAWLAGRGRVEEYPAGRTVFREGDPAEGFYILLTGTLALSRKVQQDEIETARTDARGAYMGATQAYLRDDPGLERRYLATMKAV